MGCVVASRWRGAAPCPHRLANAHTWASVGASPRAPPQPPTPAPHLKSHARPECCSSSLRRPPALGQAEFPDVERMHKAKQLEKMVAKGLWGVSRGRAMERASVVRQPDSVVIRPTHAIAARPLLRGGRLGPLQSTQTALKTAHS